MNQKLTITVAAAALLILLAAVSGYLLGRSQAADAGEWQAERLSSQAEARREAEGRGFISGKQEGRRKGLAVGRKEGTELGQRRGARSGEAAAEEKLVAIEEEERAAELEYTSQLPNGDPGYVLPEGERSIACIGISAVDGQCVGD